MKTPIFNDNFCFISPINRDNGITNINLTKQAKSTISVTISEDGRGFFEWEVPSIGEYQTGGLWFSGTELVDYDGLFELPRELIEYLEKKVTILIMLSEQKLMYFDFSDKVDIEKYKVWHFCLYNEINISYIGTFILTYN